MVKPEHLEKLTKEELIEVFSFAIDTMKRKGEDYRKNTKNLDEPISTYNHIMGNVLLTHVNLIRNLVLYKLKNNV